MKNLKVLGIKAENIKRMKVVDIELNGGVNFVSGANGQGKTSFFDCIRIAVEGSKQWDSVPIRTGEDKAFTELDLGDIVIRQTITEKGSSCTVKDKDGENITSPQSLLNSLYNKIALDLKEFTDMDGKDQYRLLKDVLGIGDLIENMEGTHQVLYDERAAWNKQVKLASAKIEGLDFDGIVGYEKMSLSDLVEEMNAANQKNKTIEEDQFKLGDLNGEIESDLERINVRENEIVALKESIALKTESIENITTRLETAQLVDIQAITDKTARIEETNAIVDSNIKHREALEEATNAKKEADKIQVKMDNIQTEMAATVEELKMPIAGLSMKDGDVLFNGIPVDQISAAEKLKVSMSIAIALNPALKIILIKDASLMDKASIEAVQDMAMEHNFQILVEIVDESGMIGIFIEDGMVVDKPINLDV